MHYRYSVRLPPAPRVCMPYLSMSAEYLRKAKTARHHAKNAPEDLRGKFLQVASDWQALARQVAAARKPDAKGGRKLTSAPLQET